MSIEHGSDDATALVGMPELVVHGQVLRDGEWWLAVETVPGPRWCPGCGVRAVGHGRSRTTVRDLPIAGTPTVLVFARRRLRCPERLCAIKTWSEQVESIAARASLTERARCRLAAMVNLETPPRHGALPVEPLPAPADPPSYLNPRSDPKNRISGSAR